jgi:hypothetical protein
LVKRQPSSDVAQGVIGKFQRSFEGPFAIRKIMNRSFVRTVQWRRKLTRSLQSVTSEAVFESQWRDVVNRYLDKPWMSIAESRKRSKAKFGWYSTRYLGISWMSLRKP